MSAGSTNLPYSGNASDKTAVHPRLQHSGKLLLIVFLAAQFLNLSRQFFIVNLSASLGEVATIITVASLGLLPFILVDYGSIAGSTLGNLQRSARLWVVILFVFVMVFGIYGFSRGGDFNKVVLDMGPFLILLTCTILGSIPQVWEEILEPLYYLTIAGAIITFLGLLDIGTLLQDNLQRRVTSKLIGYDTRTALDFWPLLLLFPASGRIFRYVSYAIPVFILILQILFQKRLPILEAGAFIAVFLFIKPLFSKQWGGKESGSPVVFAIVFAIGTFIAFSSTSVILQGQLQGLTTRFSSLDTDRVGEAQGMLESLNDQEIWLGRGMGGYFQYTDAANNEWGTYLVGVGMVRYQTHIGLVFPILKGGLLLWVVYYAQLLLVLSNLKYLFRDPLTFAAFTIVIIKHAISLQSGHLLMSATYELAMFGLCLGRILSSSIEIPPVNPVTPEQAKHTADALT